jgi:hypothetical protein
MKDIFPPHISITALKYMLLLGMSQIFVFFQKIAKKEAIMALNRKHKQIYGSYQFLPRTGIKHFRGSKRVADQQKNSRRVWLPC